MGTRAHRDAVDVTARSDRELLALLVHEVRSPSAALAAIAAALEDDSLAKDAFRDLVGLALAACRGIERIVGDAAVGSLHLEDIDVATVAQAAAAGARLGGARVEAVVDPNVPLLRADALRLRQALDNLLANAVASSPPAARVVVRVRSADDQVVLSVEDTGAGIPAADQERIFEPGVRLDTERPGSGLGLAIARAIAEAHGGTLTVDSAPGKGATFTIALRAVGS